MQFFIVRYWLKLEGILGVVTVLILWLGQNHSAEASHIRRPTKQPTLGPWIETESITFPDTVKAGDNVEVFLTVIDNAVDAAVSNGFVKLLYIDNGWSPCNGEFKLYNGTNTEGTWLAICSLPDDTMTGDYSLEVHLYDDQGNYATPQKYDGPIVVTDGTDPDITSPKIEISYENDHLHPGDTLVVSAHVTDAQSGTKKVTFGLYDIYSPDCFCKGEFSLSSGSIFDGLWSYKCLLPMDTPLSSYDGTAVAVDNRDNSGMDIKTVFIEY